MVLEVQEWAVATSEEEGAREAVMVLMLEY